MANEKMFEQLENIWNENNSNDMELIHSLATIQAYQPKLGQLLATPIYKFIAWQPGKIKIPEKDLSSFIGNNQDSQALRHNLKVLILKSYLEIYNNIVTILESPSLKKE